MQKQLPIVAIIGRPNVGKSSLFNRLVGRRQAVVANEPGTTRDPVQNQVEWAGSAFWLIDTAGMQKATDQLVADTQSQIKEAAAAADVIMLVIDAGVDIAAEDRALAKFAHKAGKPLILVANKIDTTKNQLPSGLEKLGIKIISGVSAIHGTNAAELLDEILSLLPKRLKAATTSIAPQIALLGRPNVGKSSMFNLLTKGQKAVVSDVPGTTRDVNKSGVKFHGQDFEIFDTAGIRRPGKIKDVEHFSWLRTVEAINNSDVCILVMDATEPSVAVDQKIAGLVKEAGKGLVIAINKWDSVNQEEDAQVRLEAQLQRDFAFVWWAPVVLTSAVSGHNAIKLIKQAAEISERRQTKIGTKELNRILEEAVESHPPAGLKDRHPKLNYTTQTGTNPPTFSIFGAHLEFLHWSYKRYLDKHLRQNFDFVGTPIQLVYKSKYKDQPKK